MDNSVINILEANGIKPTTPRMLILNAMQGYNRAFTLGDLEKDLLDIDKSTIFRTINLFHEKKIIHNFDDGSGSVKYSVCGTTATAGPTTPTYIFIATTATKHFASKTWLYPPPSYPKAWKWKTPISLLKVIAENVRVMQLSCNRFIYIFAPVNKKR